jgi:hypothetical protein
MTSIRKTENLFANVLLYSLKTSRMIDRQVRDIIDFFQVQDV